MNVKRIILGVLLLPAFCALNLSAMDEKQIDRKIESDTTKIAGILLDEFFYRGMDKLKDGHEAAWFKMTEVLQENKFKGFRSDLVGRTMRALIFMNSQGVPSKEDYKNSDFGERIASAAWTVLQNKQSKFQNKYKVNPMDSFHEFQFAPESDEESGEQVYNLDGFYPIEKEENPGLFNQENVEKKNNVEKKIEKENTELEQIKEKLKNQDEKMDLLLEELKKAKKSDGFFNVKNLGITATLALGGAFILNYFNKK